MTKTMICSDGHDFQGDAFQSETTGLFHCTEHASKREERGEPMELVLTIDQSQALAEYELNGIGAN